MHATGAIWVDARDPIYRHGILAALQAEGYAVAGQSAGLAPEPDLSGAAVLVVDLDAAGVERAAALARRWRVRLVGLVRELPGRGHDGRRRVGPNAVLARRGLTPSQLIACVQAVSGGGGRRAPHGDLTRREFDVLRLLADGDTTRDIARRLSYSERTVKNIVHDVRTKLDCRTRAQAVALAARRGVI